MVKAEVADLFDAVEKSVPQPKEMSLASGGRGRSTTAGNRPAGQLSTQSTFGCDQSETANAHPPNLMKSILAVGRSYNG